MPGRAYNSRLLSIDPYVGGVGFVVLEPQGEEFLVDWGLARVRSKDPEAKLIRVEHLMERFRPGHLVLEDPTSTRRGTSYRGLAKKIINLAEEERVHVIPVTMSQVKAVAPPAARTKEERAEVFVELFPHLKDLQPPPRRIWESERPRLNIFDALGFALAALCG